MARIRSIHPDALKSDKLSGATPEAERVYWRLLPLCDDAGRCEDDAVLLSSMMFPKREDILGCHVEEWLAELHECHLVERYEAEGRRYLQVTKWERYQKPQRPTPSKIPPPSGDSASAHEDSGGVHAGEGAGEGDVAGAGAQRLTPDERIACISVAAECIAANRGKPDEALAKNNPKAWLTSAVHGIRAELIDWGAHKWLTDNPGADAVALAHAFEPPARSAVQLTSCNECGWEQSTSLRPHSQVHAEWLTGEAS